MVTVRDAREEEEIMKYVGVHDVQMGKGRVRKSFASIDEVVEMPDLIEVQKNSYERFLKEDLPYLNAFMSQELARTHYLSSARSIFDILRREEVRFTAPDEIVLSVIQLMYLSILNISELGDNFFPALRALVQSACNSLVA